jgi:large subunit ribosomal protein L3
MGRRRINAPRRGSLAYLPRGRASRPIGNIGFWPEVKSDKPKLLGFAGYKAGMSFMYVIGNTRGNPTFGQEIHSPVTIIDTPPLIVCGFRGYVACSSGLASILEVWSEKLPDDLGRLFRIPRQKTPDSIEAAQSAESVRALEPTEIRALVATQPRQSGSGHKKPELFEVKVAGGSIAEQLDYLKGLLGKEIQISEVFKEGEQVDVIGVTKGKGIQGAVKRWGVKTLQHKSRKTVRGVGTLGPWTPHYVMYTVPRAGQMGFHQRTEFNKRILKIGGEGLNVVPDGGFQHYGTPDRSFVVLSGSVPGPAKRIIKMRYAVRQSSTSEEKTVITYTPFRKTIGQGET